MFCNFFHHYFSQILPSPLPPHQTPPLIPYQFLPPHHLQSFKYQPVIPLIPVLHQCPLYPLFPTLCHMHFLHSKGIDASIIHTSGNRHRRRRKVLHLLGVQVIVPDILGKFHHILNRASRMAGHKIRYQVLFLSQFLVHFFELANEFLEHFP